MTESERGLPHYLRMALVLLALLAAVIVPLIFVFGAFSVKFNLLSWRTGLDLVVTWLPRAAFSALALGILSFVLSIFIRPRGRGLPLAALAIVIPGAVLFQAAQIKAAAQAVPPIHDISTDMQNPPHFSQALIALREASGAENSLDYEGKSVNRDGDPRQVSELQRQAYPDIKPIALNAEPQAAFDAAMRAAQSLDWTVQYADPNAGRIDATDSSFWFGFKDDIAIRISLAQGGGSIVDVRSVSRVGVSDIGANAERIRAFREALTARIS